MAEDSGRLAAYVASRWINRQGTEAARAAFFGTGICKHAADDSAVESSSASDEYSCELLFSGFAFSFIDSSPAELAVLSLHDVKVDATWDSQRKGYAKSIYLDRYRLYCPMSR